MISDWMEPSWKNRQACVLFAGAMVYIIWRFNPEFKLPEAVSKNTAASVIRNPIARKLQELYFLLRNQLQRIRK